MGVALYRVQNLNVNAVQKMNAYIFQWLRNFPVKIGDRLFTP